MPTFYVTQKVHKNIEPPSGRGCVGDRRSLGMYIKRTKHLVMELPSFVLDSSDILRKLKDIIIPEDCVLAGVDLESIYSSIPHKAGVHVVSQWLEACHPLAGPHEFLIELLKMVLDNNCFMFNKKFFSPGEGRSHGSRICPFICLFTSGRVEEG